MHNYIGLNESQVLESRAKHGANIIHPPAEPPLWRRLLQGWHFWLVPMVAVLLVLSLVAWVVLPLCGVPLPTRAWIAPVILLVLLLLVWTVAYLGGQWNARTRHFSIDPLIAILLAALVLSGGIAFYQGVFGGKEGLQPFFEPIGIAIAVLLATGVGHWLEASNAKTFRSLNEADDDTPVKVVRDGNVCQVPRRDVVVGDVVLLAIGEEVPADCQLLESMSLTVNESMFTGEPEAHKGLGNVDDGDAPYPADHLLKGSIVLAGSATAVVYAVGDQSENGKVYTSAQVRDGDPTPLGRKLNQLAHLITVASYVIAALVVLGRTMMYFLDDDMVFSTFDFVKYLLDTVMIAVTLIVVAVPEGLPMAVTLSLAFSMRRLMQQGTLPRTMHACETMGAASVICTDKTGTLTQNRMQVADTYFTDPALIAESIGTNTTAHLDYAHPDKPQPVGSPTEGALLLWLHGRGQKYLDIRQSCSIEARIPFSTDLKYMATVVRRNTDGCRTLYLTGAPDILLALCNPAPDERARYEQCLLAWQNRAFRTLGLACATLDEVQMPIVDGRLSRPQGLHMQGVFAISDPIRPDVPQAIGECLAAGIQLKIITGDTPGTAREIGRQCGLWTDADTDDNILMGSQLASMTDEELKVRLPQVKIISRARPADKERAVRLLRELDHVVAVTGDGTNDAPALNRADVGLSMGDGTAVAKEASDMTILDNSFSTIARAVMWGRSLYKNIKRFILFQMTVNVAACLVVLAGAFLGTESPLTVTQMLWVNLIMDTFAALALASLPPSPAVMQEPPRSEDESILHGMGSRIVLTGGLFTILLMGLLLYLQHASVGSLLPPLPHWGNFDGLSPYELAIFFTAFVLLQFFNLFNAKAFMTHRSAFDGLSWRTTTGFLAIAAIILVGQIAIVQLGGPLFSVAVGGLKWHDWLILLLLTSLVLWIGEVLRRFKQ